MMGRDGRMFFWDVREYKPSMGMAYEKGVDCDGCGANFLWPSRIFHHQPRPYIDTEVDLCCECMEKAKAMSRTRGPEILYTLPRVARGSGMPLVAVPF